jgi:putative flippase GtrA
VQFAISLGYRTTAVLQTGRPETTPAVAAPPKPAFGWIYGRGLDLLVALCWVPIFAVVALVEARRGPSADHTVAVLFSGVFLFSLLHQPLTLALVYGDRDRFAERRTLFTWSPVVFVPLVAVAVLLDLWVIVPVAAIWNTVHTLQQRYGLCRIYGRKAGFGSARLDRALLYSWLVAVLVVVGSAPTTLRLMARVMLDDTNRGAVETLTRIRPYALWLLIPAVAVALTTFVLVVRQERANVGRANRAKWIYQGSTLVLLASIAVDPLAGLVAYVCAHSIEYFVVVYQTLRSRYGGKPATTALGRVARSGRARLLFLGAFVGAFLVLILRLPDWVSWPQYLIALYSVGILHFWYDSFIWKLRKPAVAANFGIPAPA